MSQRTMEFEMNEAEAYRVILALRAYRDRSETHAEVEPMQTYWAAEAEYAAATLLRLEREYRRM